MFEYTPLLSGINLFSATLKAWFTCVYFDYSYSIQGTAKLLHQFKTQGMQ